MPRNALVVGATGMVGCGIVGELSLQGNWNVIALARRAMSCNLPEGVIAVNGDLLDQESLRKALKGREISHLFFGAVFRNPQKIDSDTTVRQKNRDMLHNIVTVVTEGERDLQLKHITVITGAKYYGFSMPQWINREAPFTEDTPTSRHPGHNYYFDLEDYLPEAAKSQGFTWSVIRPHAVIGYPFLDAQLLVMNLGTAIGVYATLLKEMGLPLIFPGPRGAYTAKWNGISTSEVGHMAVWTATTPSCASQAFNGISSPFPYTWEQMWPRIALFFNMDYVPGKDAAVDVQDLLKDRYKVWEDTKKKHGLADTNLDYLFEIGSVDALMGLDSLMIEIGDNHMSADKLLKFGFPFREENTEMYFQCFERLENVNIVPKYSVKAKL